MHKPPKDGHHSEVVRDISRRLGVAVLQGPLFHQRPEFGVVEVADALLPQVLLGNRKGFSGFEAGEAVVVEHPPQQGCKQRVFRSEVVDGRVIQHSEVADELEVQIALEVTSAIEHDLVQDDAQRKDILLQLEAVESLLLHGRRLPRLDAALQLLWPTPSRKAASFAGPVAKNHCTIFGFAAIAQEVHILHREARRIHAGLVHLADGAEELGEQEEVRGRGPFRAGRPSKIRQSAGDWLNEEHQLSAPADAVGGLGCVQRQHSGLALVLRMPLHDALQRIHELAVGGGDNLVPLVEVVRAAPEGGSSHGAGLALVEHERKGEDIVERRILPGWGAQELLHEAAFDATRQLPGRVIVRNPGGDISEERVRAAQVAHGPQQCADDGHHRAPLAGSPRRSLRYTLQRLSLSNRQFRQCRLGQVA
mmetsp:Transcript_30790/g.89438  ORF Transcript_30790/g.89438 Transcript_30790/m.89438 type:complete len:421 (-) Transcript_30790:148-1410(-)